MIQHTHRPGYVVTTLPSGYRTEVIGGTRYYYHQDVYSRPDDSGYMVSESPHRHRGGRHAGGPHRDREGQPERYDPRYGGSVQVIRQLPRGCEVVTHRGTRYYRAGNIYYRSRGEGYILRSPF